MMGPAERHHRPWRWALRGADFRLYSHHDHFYLRTVSHFGFPLSLSPRPVAHLRLFDSFILPACHTDHPKATTTEARPHLVRTRAHQSCDEANCPRRPRPSRTISSPSRQFTLPTSAGWLRASPRPFSISATRARLRPPTSSRRIQSRSAAGLPTSTASISSSRPVQPELTTTWSIRPGPTSTWSIRPSPSTGPIQPRSSASTRIRTAATIPSTRSTWSSRPIRWRTSRSTVSRLCRRRDGSR
jgi:hypothetical protein